MKRWNTVRGLFCEPNKWGKQCQFARWNHWNGLCRIEHNNFCNQAQNSSMLRVENPYTRETHCEVPLVDFEGAKQILEESSLAQEYLWNSTSFALIERQNICMEFLTKFKKHKDEIAAEITNTMGKPLTQSYNEINGMIERGNTLIELSGYALNDDILPKIGFERKIKKEPLGVVLIIVPWNYPLLCCINSLFPAILCGNSVILKFSSKTPLLSKLYFENLFNKICNKNYTNIVKSINCNHDILSKLIKYNNNKKILRKNKISNVVFTGSVEGGYNIQSSISNRLINTTLELGGKDPAYITQDIDDNKQLMSVAETIVDGAMYNAGQSCCAIERVYCHKSKYDKFLNLCKNIVEKNYVLGNPMDKNTTMGPLAQASAVTFLENQVSDALSKGGKLITGSGKKRVDNEAIAKSSFFDPTVIADCDHSMKIMNEESFGPVLPIMPVEDDNEAISLMNDSEYGLTAAIFTNDVSKAEKIGKRVETGTVFMNRCDYLDPELPWTGVKDTGKGVSLSNHCFSQFYRLKGYHFKKNI